MRYFYITYKGIRFLPNPHFLWDLFPQGRQIRLNRTAAEERCFSVFMPVNRITVGSSVVERVDHAVIFGKV
jgi:hypothetical protein